MAPRICKQKPWCCRSTLQRLLVRYSVIIVALVGVCCILLYKEFESELWPSAESDSLRGVRESLSRATRTAPLDRRGNATDSSPASGADSSAATPLETRVDAMLRSRWLHTAGAAASTRPVRIRVATVSNRIDSTLCAEQASALASGVNVTVLGMMQPYSHVGRLKSFLDFAAKEDLADEDVVMFVDSDVLWTGMGVEEALAKFVAYSPSSPAALWPAAVRAWEDFGEYTGERYLRSLEFAGVQHGQEALLQLPPVLFSGERFCYWMQPQLGELVCRDASAMMNYAIEVARNGRSNMTASYLAKGLKLPEFGAANLLRRTDSYLAQHRVQRGAMWSPLNQTAAAAFRYTPNPLGEHNVVDRLNGGGVLMRVWALRHYASAVARFTASHRPMRPIGQDNNGWFCDQSVAGFLYGKVRMLEAAYGLLDAAPGFEKTVEVAAMWPSELQPGLLGIDRRSDFFLTAAGVLALRERNFVGTEYYNRHAGHLVHRARWYVRRLLEWRTPNTTVAAVRPGPARSASGCALTPLLIRRPPFQEDIARGYRVLRDDDVDVAVAPVVHVAGPSKKRKYRRMLRYIPWRVAAQWSSEAKATLLGVLASGEVEVWGRDTRYFVPFMQMCPDVLSQLW